MDVLFSGKAVVVKKAADQKMAARYQQAFKKSGARLRVLPVEETIAAQAPATEHPGTESPNGDTTAPDGTPTAVATPVDDAEASPASAPPGEDASGITVLPVGADMLEPAERSVVQEADIDTSHIKVQGVVFDMPVDEDVDEESLSPNSARSKSTSISATTTSTALPMPN